jgi:hypothetical protein
MVIVGLMMTFLLRNHESFRFKNLPKPIFNNGSTQPQFPQIFPTNQNSSNAQINLNQNFNQRQRAVLELQKMSLIPTQPNHLQIAIAKAQRTPRQAPQYNTAQENILIWCQMILELAQIQAKQKKYENAINIAKLITPQEPLYAQVQNFIQKWQLETKQYVNNQTLLDAAKALIIPEQASTYNRAIEVARKIQKGQPGFEIAQVSINQWSEKILDLAESRAAQGDFQTAIATAALVPEVTIAYEDAQDAIQKWQLQQKKN